MSTSVQIPEALSISLFGPMQTLIAGEPLPPIRSRKALWALALLTLRGGRPLERDWLARTLWPDVDQAQAFANLRPVLSQLRAALGAEADRIQSPDRRSLRLELTGAIADVAVFDRAIATQRFADLEAAVGLYRGPLLEGCGEEWVFQERESRERACVEALLRLGEIAGRTGDHTGAAARYRRATEIQPLSDTPRRHLMEALAQGGNPNAALDVYRQFADLLRTELNAAPDEATSQVYLRLRKDARQRLRNGSEEAPEKTSPRSGGNLPHPLTDLVGREEERIEIASQFRRSRLVTLTGLGGIGKTRLAIETARELSSDYPDGAWLIALESLSQEDLVERQVAEAFGLREESSRPSLEVALDYLRTKRLILVLDNCEHLLRASGRFVDRLLRECASIRVLATSREPLGLSGEIAWSVPALPFPEVEHLPKSRFTQARVLAGYESVQLFVDRAQATRRDFALTPNNAMAVAQVCARLEGIPLAIELAAARTKTMAVEEIAEHLDDHLRLFTGGGPLAPARQQTLRATLDWSYDLLSPDERSLLDRLSVFTGGWTLEAAEALAADSSLEVASLLESLVDRSLVGFDVSTRRYRLLETVRQYAAEKLTLAGEEERTEQAHFAWSLSFAQKADGHLRGKEHRIWIRRFLQEHDNLRAALDRATSPVDRAELVVTMGRFWLVNSYYDEAAYHLQRALANPETPSGVLRARLLSNLGDICLCRADNQQARKLFEESLSLRQGLDDAAGISKCLIGLGKAAHEEGAHDAAREFASQSLRKAEEADSPADVAVALLLQADLAATADEGQTETEYITRCLSIYRELGDEIGQATCLCYFAGVPNPAQDGLLRDAQLLEALSLFRVLGDRRGVAMVLYVIGRYRVLERNPHEAEPYLTEALDLSRSLGNRRGIVLALAVLGQVHTMTGDLVAAKPLVEESLELSRGLTGQGGGITTLEACAMIFVALRQFEEAVNLLSFCAALREKIGSSFSPKNRVLIDSLLAEAMAALGEKDFQKAWRLGETMSLDAAIAMGMGIPVR